MSKYQALSDHLAHLKGAEWRPTFHELERMLGFDLPKAARAKAGWWKNDDQGHASAWTGADWAVDRVDLAHETVAFRRIDGGEPAHPPEVVGGREFPVPVPALAVAGGVVLLGLVVAAALGARGVLNRR